MFVEVGALDVHVGEGVDGRVGDKGVGDRSQTQLQVFVKGLVGTVGVRPLRHCNNKIYLEIDYYQTVVIKNSG